MVRLTLFQAFINMCRYHVQFFNLYQSYINIFEVRITIKVHDYSFTQTGQLAVNDLVTNLIKVIRSTPML